MDLDPQKAKYLKPCRAAKALGVAVSTMARWRSEGRGPEYEKSETNRILYLTAAVLAYRERNMAQG